MNRPAAVLAICALLAAAGAFAWWANRDSSPAAPRHSTEGAPSAAPTAAPGGVPETLPAAPVIRPRRFEAAGEPEVAESRTEAAMDPTPLYVAGKVIDERRRPAPGVSMVLMIEGRGQLPGVTGADGRFRIDCGAKAAERPRGTVMASDAKGRVALASLTANPWFADRALTENVIDVGSLPLVDGAAVAMRVVKDGAGVPRARFYVGTAQSLGFGPFVTSDDGSFGGRLPDGRHLVTAFSADLALRGETRLELPRRDAAPVELAVAPAWRLDVVVRDAAGKGVAGQHPSLMSSIETDNAVNRFPATIPGPVQPTNAEGRTVVAGLSPERAVNVELGDDAEGFRGRRPFGDGLARAVAKPGTNEVVLTIGAGGETITFPIVADESPGPPDGAEVKLSVPDGHGGAPPPPRGKVVGTNLVIDGVTKRCINILVTADDGSRAIVLISPEARNTKVGSEAKFKLPRRLHVTAHDRAGKPLAGQLVQCRDPGNNPVGGTVTISADGTALLEGLPARKVDVVVRRPTERSPFAGRVAGNADLTKPGDARVELILERERRCLLRVTVDGEKQLPATISVSTVGERGFSMGDLGPLEEDPDEGTLRFPLRPDPKVQAVKLTAIGKGCPPVDVTLPVTDDDSVLEGAVAFVTGGTVRIHVVPPSDNLHSVGLEFWYPERSAWGPRGSRGPFGRDVDATGGRPTEIAMDGLPAGRYRARDAMTGVATDAIELAAGASAEITIDLSRAGPVTGRVEGPAAGEAEAPGDFAQRQASVLIEGSGISQMPGDRPGQFETGISVNIGSEFKARVPGDRPVTFRVKHMLLAPDPSAGSATVTAPGSTIVLKLVKGAELRFRAAGAVPAVPPDTPGRKPRVLFFAEKTTEQALHTADIVWDAGGARVGGFKPGAATLFVDVLPGAPLVLENVELGEGVTDLGELKFAEGATLRVKVVTRDGQQPPRVAVSVTALAPPVYWRSGTSRDAADVLVKGLGPGRHKVEVRTTDFRAAATTYEVESTGAGEIPLTHDVR